MNCAQAQSNLSLYLYGELEFATEDALELHLASCAFCQLALAREKQWHASLNDGQQSVPFELLADCRTNLQRQLAAAPPKLPNEVWRERLNRQLGSFFQICYAWPARAAIAGFLLLLGFGAGRWTELRSVNDEGRTRVRSVSPTEDGRVRIVVEKVREAEIVGSITDNPIRRLLIGATSERTDPATRVDAVGVLTGQSGPDIQQALISTLHRDPNPAVRLKALEGLRPVATTPSVRAALIAALQTDTDPGIRSEAIDVLLRGAQTPDVIQAAQAAAADQQDDYVRARAIQFLRSIGGAIY
jgi:hypothetical protein